MAEGENRSQSLGSSEERFKYIGFDVFPGKAGDIFKSDKEHQSLIQKVMKKFNRSEGEVRDRCTLMEERVSKLERSFLGVAAVLMFAALFLPWFSGHFEITNIKQVAITEERVTPVDTNAAGADSLAGLTDSVNATGTVEAEVAEPAAEETVAATAGEEPAVAGEEFGTDTDLAAVTGGNEIRGYRTVTEVTHDRRSLTGLGALFAIGSYGSMVFSSGFAVMLTGILLLLYMLCCIGLAGFNLYLIFGVKKSNSDEYALFLKDKLRLNWIPIYIFLAMVLLSLIGSNYGFNSDEMVKQVGDSYSIASFIGLLSAGIYVSLAAFMVAALKGKEI